MQAGALAPGVNKYLRSIDLNGNGAAAYFFGFVKKSETDCQRRFLFDGFLTGVSLSFGSACMIWLNRSFRSFFHSGFPDIPQASALPAYWFYLLMSVASFFQTLSLGADRPVRGSVHRRKRADCMCNFVTAGVPAGRSKHDVYDYGKLRNQCKPRDVGIRSFEDRLQRS